MANTRVKTGIFLQVRLNSKRLQEKALLPLKGGNVIEHAMRALKQVPSDVYALLTDEQSEPGLKVYAESNGFLTFAGHSEDVLKRYCAAARFFGVTRIIRATGDNPLVSAKQIKRLLPIHAEKNVCLSHYIGPPMGTGVEIVETEALYQAERESSDPFEHEHITTYLYRNPEKFLINEIPSPGEITLVHAHVSVDTKNDYALISQVFEDLYHGKPIETEELIGWLNKNKSRAAAALCV